MNVDHLRRGLVAAVAGLSTAVSLELFTGNAEKVVLCVIAALGALGVVHPPRLPRKRSLPPGE